MKRKENWLSGKSCPECGGRLRGELRPFSMRHVFFGNYPFHVCVKCGDVLTPLETYRRLEKVARAKRLFGRVGVASGGPHAVTTEKGARAAA
ncbi:MAG: hypothetical protein KGJ23_12465 [Euryarchaeota archaeon]|nr:hypothetical protein [Euryarchaeota archaeon]MDE1837411.1 hypothetical protein [Euryarchaeota archaeon]MDE1879906.1 hypothetical protein [Euryarchaeota archaeon]MDE2045489.1 hypothetical protein [Thermoplasmata archaeon]